MKTTRFCVLLFLMASLMLSCGNGGAPAEEQPAAEGSESSADLVQPPQWWDVHPRPVYATLEKVGTYQAWFDVYKLAEGTYAIYEPNQFEESICFLVEGSERAALIDAGTGIGNLAEVVSELTDLPVFVVLTHAHYDHVGSAYRWDTIEMFDNEDEIAVLRRGRDNESLLRYATGDYLWKPLPEGFDARAWTIPSMEPTSLFHDGDGIDLGERTLEVIWTPGHSPGSVCLLDAKHRLLFTGDHFFPGPLYAFSGDVNIDDYIVSNKKLVERLGEYDFLCAGHNDPWVRSEVIPRVSEAFDTVLSGGGEFSEAEGLRRYKFDGFDILIRTDMIGQ